MILDEILKIKDDNADHLDSFGPSLILSHKMRVDPLHIWKTCIFSRFILSHCLVYGFVDWLALLTTCIDNLLTIITIRKILIQIL